MVQAMNYTHLLSFVTSLTRPQAFGFKSVSAGAVVRRTPYHDHIFGLDVLHLVNIAEFSWSVTWPDIFRHNDITLPMSLATLHSRCSYNSGRGHCSPCAILGLKFESMVEKIKANLHCSVRVLLYCSNAPTVQWLQPCVPNQRSKDRAVSITSFEHYVQGCPVC